jgi:membrane protein required for colicin V production
MNNFDLTLLFIVFLSSLLGFFRGFFASLFSSFGWIIAIYGNHKIFFKIEPFLIEKLGSKFLTFTLGYLGGLLLLLFFFAIVNFLAKTFVSQLKLGFFDKILGGFFGLIRGVAMIIFSFLLLDQTLVNLIGDSLKSDQIPDFIKDSASLPLMREGELFLVKYLPKEEKKYQDQVQILQIISKLTSHLPPEKIKTINQKLEDRLLTKQEKIIVKLQKLWELYKEERDKNFLTKEEIDLIKRII